MPSSSSSSQSYRRTYTKEEIICMTHCKCEIPIYQQVAWTSINPGRRFKACPIYDKKEKCDVYGFIDDELPLEYYKDLFYKLHNKNKELKSKLKVLSKHDCGHNKLIPNKEESEQVSMDMIYKELNAFKIKAKVYDSVMVVFGFGFMIVLILCVYVVSKGN
ncbi:hypothetical protein Tco_0449553 [Tanacetum coccineum]